jgi:hypothetical protein
MTTTNFYESLNELVTDTRFRTLAVTQNFESYLGTSGINEAENMYTFGWLLDPRGSHGLKDMFLRELMISAWSMIHGQYGDAYKAFKGSKFYTGISPVALQSATFANAYIDRTMVKTWAGADMVITDVATKTLIVINNRYEEGICNKAHAHFTSGEYNYFENKLFISFSGEVQTVKGCQWMYMNNEWLINLCTSVIECPQYANQKVTATLRDFYQFLTGCQYGTNHEAIAEYSATLMGDYYGILKDLRTYKAEKISNIALVDITPREYATQYAGKISEKEYSVLSLFWAYKNTFKTFFQLCDLEGVTHDVCRMVEKKQYRIDRTFVRNGLRFTPSFTKYGAETSFFNSIFDVEAVMDMGKNLSLNLVINKGSWDRLTVGQRETIQKNFGTTGVVLADRVIVWNAFYKQDWMKKDLGTEIVNVFEKVNTWISGLGIKAA